ncbi:hypothetical protein [Algivirga pacifica]|uniref:Uncharacterized protein n=1 Tax=Algivirga pacifica TaxID=1162670 RepID=A0ABP9DEU2_9BACT
MKHDKMMKSVRWYLFLVALMMGCFGPTPEKPLYQVDKEHLKDIEGAYLPVNFIDRLKNTKSAYEASDELSHVSELLIIGEVPKEGAFPVDGGWGNFEGINLSFTVNDQERFVTLYDSVMNMWMIVNQQKGAPQITLIDSLDNTRMQRVYTTEEYLNNGEGNNLNVVNYFVNEQVMRGVYETEKGRLIRLYADGRIQGLQDFTNYYVFTTFSGELPPDDVLQVSGPNREAVFVYRFSDEQLYLKEVEIIEDLGSPYGGLKIIETGVEYHLKKVK